MQASYASGCALGLPHRILGTQKSMETIQYGFACLMRTFFIATEARSAVVAGQTGGVPAPFPRFRFENNWNKWNMFIKPQRNGQKVCSNSDFANWNNWNEAHAASLLYVRPHPTAARRAATLASSGCEMHMGARISIRPLQRRFKARKKPEGYSSTPTGLKRKIRRPISPSRLLL